MRQSRFSELRLAFILGRYDWKVISGTSLANDVFRHRFRRRRRPPLHPSLALPASECTLDLMSCAQSSSRPALTSTLVRISWLYVKRKLRSRNLFLIGEKSLLKAKFNKENLLLLFCLRLETSTSANTEALQRLMQWGENLFGFSHWFRL